MLDLTQYDHAIEKAGLAATALRMAQASIHLAAMDALERAGVVEGFKLKSKPIGMAREHIWLYQGTDAGRYVHVNTSTNTAGILCFPMAADGMRRSYVVNPHAIDLREFLNAWENRKQ